MLIDGGSATFNNVTFRGNGYLPTPAEATSLVRDCLVFNQFLGAVSSADLFAPLQYGGAIFVDAPGGLGKGVHLRCTNCTFEDNSAGVSPSTCHPSTLLA